ncbi:hypothetical protein TA3x_001101 [Tundrisphaera sp. TA3]|uniref:hypothetical protein n=1 Tax=Tundrisphaera sp. TA3 TaxID=3435775 RepID=UPI003EC13EB4
MAANDGTPSQEAVAKRMGQMPEKVSEAYRTRLGTYRGLECGLILHPLGGTEVYLDGATRCRETLMRDNPGPRAVLNALARVADDYEDCCRRNRAEIALKEGQLHDYETRLGKAFEHEAYQSQLADLRDELKLALSEHAPEGGRSTKEIAEAIGKLRESVTVEAAPERVARKAARAEVPVTARIRARRVEPVPHVAESEAVTPAAEVIALPVPAPVEEPPAVPPAAPVMPAMYVDRSPEHAQRVSQRRRADGAQLRLF